MKYFITVLMMSVCVLITGCKVDLQEWADSIYSETNEVHYDLDPEDVANDPVYYNVFNGVTMDDIIITDERGIGVIEMSPTVCVFIFNTEFHKIDFYDLERVANFMFGRTGSLRYDNMTATVFKDTIIIEYNNGEWSEELETLVTIKAMRPIEMWMNLQ